LYFFNQYNFIRYNIITYKACVFGLYEVTDWAVQPSRQAHRPIVSRLF